MNSVCFFTPHLSGLLIWVCLGGEGGRIPPPPPRDPNIVYCKTCYLFSIFYTRAEKVAEKCYAATPQMREYCNSCIIRGFVYICSCVSADFFYSDMNKFLDVFFHAWNIPF